jgi:hypothetical protein
MDDVYSAVFTQRHFALQNDPPDDFRFSSCSRFLSCSFSLFEGSCIRENTAGHVHPLYQKKGEKKEILKPFSGSSET